MSEILYNHTIVNFQVIILLDYEVSDIYATADSVGKGLSTGISFLKRTY